MAKHLTDYFHNIEASKPSNIVEASISPTKATSDTSDTDNQSDDVWSTDWRLDWLKKNNPKKYKQIVGE